MAAGKNFPLSISLISVDKATTGIERVNKKLEALNAPSKRFGAALKELGEHSGIDKLKSGFSTIGKELRSIATGIGIVGGVAAGAVLGFKAMSEEFDNLGDSAKRIGIAADALAQLRDIAVQSDADVATLDSSLGTFNKNLGQVKAGTGRLTGFLKKVSPALLEQMKGAKSSEEAFGFLANAMAKLKDPAKKAALSAAAGFDATLIPMLSLGADEIARMREEFTRTHGSFQPAVDAADEVDGALKSWGKALNDVKADIVTGVGPAFADLVTKATSWLEEHREEIAAWAKDFGEKLPGRIEKLIGFIGDIKDALMPVIDAVRWFVDKVGGAENAVKLLVGAWVTFKALKIAAGLVEIGSGLMSMASTAKTVGMAIAGGGGFLGWAAGITAAAAAGYALGTLFDQWIGASDYISDKLINLFGEAGFAQSEATANSRARAQKFKGMSDAEVSNFANDQNNSQKMRNAAFQELASRSSARDSRHSTKERTDAPKLGAAGLGGQPPVEIRAMVEFENAPMGTRVKVDADNGADVDVYTGFTMAPS